MSGLSASNLVKSFLEFHHRRVINRSEVAVILLGQNIGSSKSDS
jgi:hypothetical protein